MTTVCTVKNYYPLKIQNMAHVFRAQVHARETCSGQVKVSSPPVHGFRVTTVHSQCSSTQEQAWVINIGNHRGLPWRLRGEESACQARTHGFDPSSGRIPHATEQLSLCTTTSESMLWSPEASTTEAWAPHACAPQQVRPPPWVVFIAQLNSPCLPQLEKSPHNKENPAQTKIKKIIKKKSTLLFKKTTGYKLQ